MREKTLKKQMWRFMCAKDREYSRRKNPLENHRQLSLEARTMVVDWLMDVAATERLHRETFHLAVDYFDRYLTSFPKGGHGVPLQQLQLVGTTALVLAAKYEVRRQREDLFRRSTLPHSTSSSTTLTAPARPGRSGSARC